jgi:hypothetical protein
MSSTTLTQAQVQQVVAVQAANPVIRIARICTLRGGLSPERKKCNETLFSYTDVLASFTCTRCGLRSKSTACAR